MQIIYIVYREDNTMVFNSQVLEYLSLLKNDYKVNLYLFRNHETFFKKEEVEKKISGFLNNFITFSSLPPLTFLQLNLDAIRLKMSIESKFKKDEPLLIHCRGELSTYIAHKAFKDFTNKKILFDNRGLPVEELDFRGKNNLIYSLNKRVKKNAVLYAKDNCDIYSFVTNNLRDYLLENYNYSTERKYFIVPTLNSYHNLEEGQLAEIKKEINYNPKNFYLIYIGSVAAWQSINSLFDVFLSIKTEINSAKLLILTNGRISVPHLIKDDVSIRSVKYDQVKYYLNLSDLGLVIRNNSIVNKVAAPTKIAEYLSQNVPILYDGEIGVIDDLIAAFGKSDFIKLSQKDWIDKVKNLYHNKQYKEIKSTYQDYFDMATNQRIILEKIKNEFKQ
ncbi:glycosyltransferase family protein [Neobacillus mesonae]|uniref:hypothetical protein n=1 Tax=Neobacillus mesonae TaxID=1193713 RepID=UPI000832BB0A|nr:hypothetical protein [Neobacillus mesonae]